ncbi:MAG: L,D-transpeptidase family protein [Alphaproteobacteria bacterium]|nr:L,D-transpeptidase family protein [Alphaproteobacteria bacterium]
MKKNKILWFVVAVFLCVVAYSGWYLGSYYIPKPAPYETHTVKVDKIIVEKALRKLTLFSNNNIVDVFDISLGAVPDGNKEKDYDGKTPEGIYVITHKHKDSRNLFALQISYPNKEDILEARKRQIDLTQNVYIHGYPNVYPNWLGDLLLKNKDWTDGSIGATNSEIEKLWGYVKIGTTIEIRP